MGMEPIICYNRGMEKVSGFDIDYAKQSLGMDGRDPLLTQVSRLSGRGSEYFEALFQLPHWSVQVVRANSQEKTYSGDRVILSSEPTGEIKALLLDGITQPFPVSEKLASMMQDSVQQKISGDDEFIPELLTENGPYIFGDKYSPDNVLGDTLRGVGQEELYQAGHISAKHYFSYSYSPSCIETWLNSADLIDVINHVYGVYPTKGDKCVDRPGAIGTSMSFDDDTFTLSWSQIADAPVFLVLENGSIKDLSINTNSWHDTETVNEVRKKIKNGEAKDIYQAKTILRQGGYYQRSFKEKVNSTFAVCNGSSLFSQDIANFSPSVSYRGLNIEAAIFASDGPLYYLNGNSQLEERNVELVSFVSSILRRESGEAIVGNLEEKERKSFDPKDPHRERLSDDKAILSFVRKHESTTRLEDIIRRLHVV